MEHITERGVIDRDGLVRSTVINSRGSLLLVQRPANVSWEKRYAVLRRFGECVFQRLANYPTEREAENHMRSTRATLL